MCHVLPYLLPTQAVRQKINLTEIFLFHPQTLPVLFLCISRFTASDCDFTGFCRTVLQSGAKPLGILSVFAQSFPTCVAQCTWGSKQHVRTLTIPCRQQGPQLPSVLHRANHAALRQIVTARWNLGRMFFTTNINEIETYKFFTSMIPRKAFLGIPFIWFSLRSLKKGKEKVLFNKENTFLKSA